MISQYRKKPVVIDAGKFLNDETTDFLLNWINEGQHDKNKPFAQWINGTLIIPTLEGDHGI